VEPLTPSASSVSLPFLIPFSFPPPWFQSLDPPPMATEQAAEVLVALNPHNPNIPNDLVKFVNEQRRQEWGSAPVSAGRTGSIQRRTLASGGSELWARRAATGGCGPKRAATGSGGILRRAVAGPLSDGGAMC
ncbi:unnamed protein product, partial [Urochloa humidicola]